MNSLGSVLNCPAATEGFTGADIKRLVEDAKAIYAYDKSRRLELRPTTEYFLSAVKAVSENKAHYAAAESHAALRPKNPMAAFMSRFGSPPTPRTSDEDDS